MDRYVDMLHATLTTDMISSETKIHPEECGNLKINMATKEGLEDIQKIDNTIKELGNKIDDLLTRTTDRLENVKHIIISEKERLQDMTMLCNNKTDYDNAIPLSDYHFEGDYNYKDGVFSSKTEQSTSNIVQIIDVSGNGYEGNKYVRKDMGYLSDVLDTSIKKYATDNNISDYWEYSRITASNKEPYLISDFNTDTAEAKTTITLKFNQKTNELAIKSTINNIKVVSVRYSDDNVSYKDLDIMPFSISNREDSYKKQGYIYGSNIISFPNSYYAKITFESTGYLDETISFERVIANTDKNETVTTIVPSAKRHVVRINNIEAKSKKYMSESVFKTKELITTEDDIYAISIFANMYFPNKIPNDHITFILTINGQDYEVQPVNSYNDGIKIIRFSQGKIPVKYTRYIGEKITSAYLTVKIKSKNKITPYINNLKVLLGGEV